LSGASWIIFRDSGGFGLFQRLRRRGFIASRGGMPYRITQADLRAVPVHNSTIIEQRERGRSDPALPLRSLASWSLKQIAILHR
jgi:hypothetical protein